MRVKGEGLDLDRPSAINPHARRFHAHCKKTLQNKRGETYGGEVRRGFGPNKS